VRVPVVIVSGVLPTVTAESYDAQMSDTGGRAPEEPALSERDRAVLALERRGWPPGGGTKERVIRERLDMSPTRYYQLLNALLDDPAALAHDPVTVNRLRRLRDERRAQR
jgi:hypothetical protein